MANAGGILPPSWPKDFANSTSSTKDLDVQFAEPLDAGPRMIGEIGRVMCFGPWARGAEMRRSGATRAPLGLLLGLRSRGA